MLEGQHVFEARLGHFHRCAEEGRPGPMVVWSHDFLEQVLVKVRDSGRATWPVRPPLEVDMDSPFEAPMAETGDDDDSDDEDGCGLASIHFPETELYPTGIPLHKTARKVQTRLRYKMMSKPCGNHIETIARPY